MTLPVMLNEHGELIQLVTASHLLQAAGLDDLTQAEVEQLAQFTDNADHLAAIAKEAKGAVGDELIRRLDRRGMWTLRDGDWTITAPSPTAGTTSYDLDQLRDTLEQLVADDVIDREAATAALEFVQPPPPEPFWKLKQAGVNALLKMGPDVAAAVEACRVEVDPPRRTAKVKRAA